jgi:hypothetical protein
MTQFSFSLLLLLATPAVVSAAAALCTEPCSQSLYVSCSRALELNLVYGSCCSLADSGTDDCILTVAGSGTSCSYKFVNYTCNPTEGCLPEYILLSAETGDTECPASSYAVPEIMATGEGLDISTGAVDGGNATDAGGAGGKKDSGTVGSVAWQGNSNTTNGTDTGKENKGEMDAPAKDATVTGDDNSTVVASENTTTPVSKGGDAFGTDSGSAPADNTTATTPGNSTTVDKTAKTPDKTEPAAEPSNTTVATPASENSTATTPGKKEGEETKPSKDGNSTTKSDNATSDNANVTGKDAANSGSFSIVASAYATCISILAMYGLIN